MRAGYRLKLAHPRGFEPLTFAFGGQTLAASGRIRSALLLGFRVRFALRFSSVLNMRAVMRAIVIGLTKGHHRIARPGANAFKIINVTSLNRDVPKPKCHASGLQNHNSKFWRAIVRVPTSRKLCLNILY